MTKIIDMAGMKIGRLTVLTRAKNSEGRQAQWECRACPAARRTGRLLLRTPTQAVGMVG